MAATAVHYSHVNLASEFHGRAYHAVDSAYSDTRWERVRAALFTDWSPQPNARDSMVRRLAEPSRNIRRAIEQMLALQREADKELTPAELLQLLRSSDPNVVARGVKEVVARSKTTSSIATQEIIETLFKLTRCGDQELEKAAAGAIQNLSENQEGRMYIFRSGGLAELIRMLRSENQSLVGYALTTLHRLLQHIPQTRPEARKLRATHALVPLLQDRNPKVLALAADCCFMLMNDDREERTRFSQEGGIRHLTLLLISFENHPKVVYTALRCIRALSGGQDAGDLKFDLIHSDILLPLYSILMKTEEQKTREAILACLRNLSDAVSNEQDLSALIVALLEIIGETRYAETDVVYAAGVLSNLTCNNHTNKTAVFESEGVAILVDAISRRPTASDETVTEPALCALRHCTARHTHAAAAQRELVRRGGWRMLLEQLRTLRPPVAKAALGVTRNAALLKENRAALVESPDGQSLIAVTVEILSSAASELRTDTMATSDDGVGMWELAEAAGGALHQLAAHATIAGWLLHAEQSLLPIVREILESDEAAAADEVMQRELLGLLYQLSKTESGVAQLEAHQFVVPVEKCLHSPHPSVVTYAAGVLNNLKATEAQGDYGYGNPNWDAARGAAAGGAHSEYQTMGSELGEGYEPELFGYHAHSGMRDDNYGLDRIDHSFRMPHNNSDWFDTDL